MRPTLFVIFASLAFSTPAWAQNSSPSVRSQKTEDGYEHAFDDDLLNSTTTAPKGWVIRIRGREVRVPLIVPRTTFVPELNESVEQL